MTKPFPARIADILADSIREVIPGDEPSPTLATIVSRLGTRSFGIVMVLFGLPNLLPVPGLPMLCGVVVGVVAVQMFLGKESLVLPGWLAGRRVNRRDLARVLERAEPTLRWFEKVMRPRLLGLTSGDAERLIGVLGIVLAILLMAPIPFFGGIPPGIAIILLGLAIVERDGVFVIAGVIATIFAFFFTVALTYAIVRQLLQLFLTTAGFS